MRRRAKLNGRAVAPLFILILVAALTFLFPLPREQRMLRVVAKAAVAAATPGDKVAVVGNSVIGHVSKCDADRRDISAMIADDLHRPVVDLSYGGQAFEETVNLAGMALRTPHIRRVILPVPIAGFADADAMDLQSQAFFRLAAGPLAMNDIGARFGRGIYLSPGIAERVNSFTYKGKAYPDYNGVKTQYFEPERRTMPCPEVGGRNPEFMEAYYWINFVKPDPWPAHLADVRRLAELPSAKGRLTIVLMPMDFPGVRKMPATLQADVVRRRDGVLAYFRNAEVDVLDATDLVGPGGFADGYCVCGHLTESGRSAVAKAVAAKVGGAG